MTKRKNPKVDTKNKVNGGLRRKWQKCKTFQNSNKNDKKRQNQ